MRSEVALRGSEGISVLQRPSPSASLLPGPIEAGQRRSTLCMWQSHLPAGDVLSSLVGLVALGSTVTTWLQHLAHRQGCQTSKVASSAPAAWPKAAAKQRSSCALVGTCAQELVSTCSIAGWFEPRQGHRTTLESPPLPAHRAKHASHKHMPVAPFLQNAPLTAPFRAAGKACQSPLDRCRLRTGIQGRARPFGGVYAREGPAKLRTKACSLPLPNQLGRTTCRQPSELPDLRKTALPQAHLAHAHAHAPQIRCR